MNYSKHATPDLIHTEPDRYEIDDNWLHRGQKVKILNKYFADQIGTVQSFMWNTGEYIVTLESGHDVPFGPSELEKVEWKQTSLSEQIQSASYRASEAQRASNIMEKIQEPEI